MPRENFDFRHWVFPKMGNTDPVVKEDQALGKGFLCPNGLVPRPHACLPGMASAKEGCREELFLKGEAAFWVLMRSFIVSLL